MELLTGLAPIILLALFAIYLIRGGMRLPDNAADKNRETHSTVGGADD